MYCYSLNNLGWSSIIDLGAKLLMKQVTSCLQQVVERSGEDAWVANEMVDVVIA